MDFPYLPLDPVRCVLCYQAHSYARVLYKEQLEWDTDNEEINVYCFDCFVKIREQPDEDEEDED